MYSSLSVWVGIDRKGRDRKRKKNLWYRKERGEDKEEMEEEAEKIRKGQKGLNGELLKAWKRIK